MLCSYQRELVVIMSRDSRSNVSICSIKVPPALPLGLGDVQTSLHLRRSFEYAEEYLICRDFSQSAGQTRHHSGEKPHAPTGEVKYWEDVSTAPCVSVDWCCLLFVFFKVLWRWLLMSVKHPFYFRHSTRMSLKDADGLLRGTWTQIMYFYDNSEANIILFTPLQFLTAIVISWFFFFSNLSYPV